ncbi:MAG: sensor domain-containing diguanylate cyclase [Treponema sp.]|nr:sensor domain-containing diguanylate cyclase [Treponema sp.]MBR0476681.1 sensor domain-containing diguanylate cyclase [Treponema sp.]
MARRKKGSVTNHSEESQPAEKTKTPAEYEKEIYDLKQMIEISRSLCTTLELSKLIESTLFITMAQMHVLAAGIFILNSVDSFAYSLGNNYNGFDVDMSKEYSIPMASTLVEYIVENREQVFTLKDLEKHITGSKELKLLQSLNITLLVPLVLKNRVNGLLVLGERFAAGAEDGAVYDEYDKQQISIIASLAAVAINNASLLELSSTDMMTHLKLKYYFFNVLTDKLDSAIMQDVHLSVLMFDIDFFKKFNDTYGHACGDYVLQQVASLIKGSIRSQDLASRYGGEEFTVLLSDTNKKDAVFIADRIRKNIEAYDFEYENKHMKVTVSGGVAVFSSETNPVKSAKALVDQADQALYVSKRNGRNRVTFADPSFLTVMGNPELLFEDESSKNNSTDAEKD